MIKLDGLDLKEVLAEKKIGTIFHANTVRTVCTFLKHECLMSRGFVEKRQYPQTLQQSDGIDKKYEIWNDLFFDGVDIHNRINRKNNYGPVLLEFDVQLLLQDKSHSLGITKINPQNWKDSDTAVDRWFSSVDEVHKLYQQGRFDQIFVRSFGCGLLPLQPYLKKITLDNPQTSANNVNIYIQAIQALRASAQIGNLSHIPISQRICDASCVCSDQYNNMSNEVLEKFFKP